MDFGEIKRLNIFQPILCKKGEPGIQSSPKYSITHLSKTFDETFCIKSCANNGRYVLYNSLMNCETPKYFASFLRKSENLDSKVLLNILLHICQKHLAKQMPLCVIQTICNGMVRLNISQVFLRKGRT
jgi:hypothetical protein